MSIENALSWLQQHTITLPPFKHSLNFFASRKEQKPTPKMADFICSDPALSLALLKKVNANRSPDSGKDIVCSAQAAISLLGERVTHELLESIPIAESQLKHPDQLFLYSQICNRSLHNQQQMVYWAQHLGFHQTDEFRLPALLYFIGESLCCCHDFSTYLKYIKTGSQLGTEVNFFGFDFKQLTAALSNESNLPVLISQAQQVESSKNQQAKLLLHIASICHLCEHGWFNSLTSSALELLAETFQQPVDRVTSRFHQNCVDFSRASYLHLSWQPAARLPLINDHPWIPAAPEVPPEKQRNAVTLPSQKPKSTAVMADGNKKSPHQATKPVHVLAIERLKKLLTKKETTQSQLLHSCIEGLSADLGFQRVGLFLLSRDKTTLQNRMAVGMDKNSPLRQCSLSVNQSGLFQILLKKPQAIHVSPGNIKKYAALIPSKLQACIQTQEFLAMSLFIGDKPVAIIYADHKGNSAPFEAADFKHFKLMISFCSKALAFLQKKSA